jgi:hypothetical protein
MAIITNIENHGALLFGSPGRLRYDEGSGDIGIHTVAANIFAYLNPL